MILLKLFSFRQYNPKNWYILMFVKFSWDVQWRERYHLPSTVNGGLPYILIGCGDDYEDENFYCDVATQTEKRRNTQFNNLKKIYAWNFHTFMCSWETPCSDFICTSFYPSTLFSCKTVKKLMINIESTSWII